MLSQKEKIRQPSISLYPHTQKSRNLLEVSRQFCVTGRTFEEGPDQKKNPNIECKKYEYKNQIGLGTPHKKQEDYEAPVNEIETDGNIISRRRGPVRVR